VVSVLATRHKGCGFKSSRGDGFLKGDINPQHAFLRMGSSPEGLCRKILRHVKDPLTYQSY
jgi:hypothetical protein